MDVKVLDSFDEGAATCILAKTTLPEYLSGLPSDFEEYFIQRGIVSNKYLDRLWDTVAKGFHIPSMVLVSSGPAPELDDANNSSLSGPFKILDGLQRTKRLITIKNVADFIDGEFEDDLDLSVAVMGRRSRKKLQALDCSPKLFVAMLGTSRDQNGQATVSELIEQTRIGVEVWFNLDTDLQIKKMLILNAGHKSVNIKHQIELLFFNYLDHLQRLMPSIQIVRERETSSISYSKSRTPAQFHFSHLISAFVSLGEGKAVTTNSDFSVSRSFDHLGEEDFPYLDDGLLDDFTGSIEKLDEAFSDALGAKWIGREVVLVGLFGGIGKFADERNMSKSHAIKLFNERVSEFRKAANLEGFEDARNSLELSKVNIGNKNKQAVFEAIFEFMGAETKLEIDWRRLFGIGGEK